jgi:small multidrug resistance pump
MKKEIMNYILCLIYLSFSVAGLTLMKLGSVKTALPAWQIPILNLRLNFISASGYLCYIISFLLYTVVITKFDLGFIIPMLSGLVNVAIFIIAVILFKESFTVYSIIGLFLISIGVFLMNLK